MEEPQVYIDGKFFPKSQASVNVFDHGLLYGDGVFEGIRAYNGQVFLCKEHIDRIYEGAHCLLIDIPLAKNEMRDILYKCLEVNKLKDAYFRLIVTRGVGDLGLSPRKCTKKGTVICICTSIALYPDEYYEKGLKIITSSVLRAHPETLNPRVKSLNYLSNILAKIEGLNAGCEEALMLNHKGEVSECTGDNIFIIKNGELKTPPVYSTILEGCTRNCVMELAAKDGMKVSETVLARYDIYNADECFLTGTAAEIIPVVSVDERKISEGKAGKTTTKLLKMFREFIKNYKDTGL